MKRLLSLILCIVMLCGVLPTAVTFAEESSDDTVLYDKQVKLLTDIGMFTENIVGDYAPDNILNRYDLAKLMRCFINGHNMTTEDVYYTDTKGMSEINALTALGIFNGNPNGYFEPYANATNHQAYISILRALGYGTYIQVRDMSMLQCATYAKTLGICTNPGTEHWLTMRELVDIFYNSLEVPVLRAEVYTDEDAEFTANSNQNVLSEFFGLYVIDGSVTATEYTNILGSGELAEGEIAIDGVIYGVDMLHAEDYIAREVKAYIREGGEARDTVIAFEANMDDVIEITKDNSPVYSNFKLTYYTGEENRERSVNLPASVVVVYNGRVTGVNYESAFNLTEGTIRLYKNRHLGDGYSVAVIEDFKTAVVKTREIGERIFYTDRTDALKKLECDKNDTKIKFFDATNGRVISYDTILQNSVLSVKQSMDAKVTEIYLCQTYFQGTVEKLNNTGGKLKATISGTEYTFAEDFVVPSSLTIGYTGRFFTNTYGRICGVSAVSSDNRTQGYLYAIDNEDEAFNSKIAVRIFDINGAHIEAELAKNVKLDGVSKAKADILTAPAIMSGGTLKRQLVEFGMNSKGEINYIDTAALSADAREDAAANEVSASTVYEYGAMAERRWVNSQFSFDAQYPLSRNRTKVIIVPPTTEAADASKFRVVQFTGSDFLVNNEKYKMAFYKKDSKHPFVETAVYELAEVPAYHYFPSLLVVSEVTTSYDEISDEIYPNITGYYMTRNSTDRNMVSFSMQVADNVYERTWYKATSGSYSYKDSTTPISGQDYAAKIGEGDIIWYQTDISGRIARSYLVYDYSEDKAGWNIDGMDYHANYMCSLNHTTPATPNPSRNDNFMIADVESVFRNTAKPTSQSLITLSHNGTVCDELSLLPSYFKAIVFEKGERDSEFYQGTLNDIVSKEQTDGDCSRLFAFRLGQQFYNMLVIYK